MDQSEALGLRSDGRVMICGKIAKHDARRHEVYDICPTGEKLYSKLLDEEMEKIGTRAIKKAREVLGASIDRRPYQLGRPIA